QFSICGLGTFMSKFTNPLDHLKIAALCSADWDQMYEYFMRNIRIVGCLALAIALVNTAWPVQTGGRIKGTRCYPSEYLPPMTVYARDTKTGKTYSTYVEDKRYTLNVPAGTYIVFAWTEKIPYISGGSYSQAVPCGLHVSCSDHSPIPVTVKPGKTVTGKDICDFYSEKDVPLPSARDKKPALVPVQLENDPDAPLVITEAGAELSAPYETILKGTKGDGQEVTLINKGEKARRIKLTLQMFNKSNLTVIHSTVRLLNPDFLSDESILISSRLWIRNPGWPLEIKPQETFTVTTDLPLADRRNGQELANHLSGFRVKVVEATFTHQASQAWWTEGDNFSNLYGRVEDMVMVIDCAGGTAFRLVKKGLASEPPPTQ